MTHLLTFDCLRYGTILKRPQKGSEELFITEKRLKATDSAFPSQVISKDFYFITPLLVIELNRGVFCG